MVEAIDRVILTETQDRERRTLAQEQGIIMSQEEYLAMLPKVLDSRYLIANLPVEKVHKVKTAAGLREVRVW